MRSLRRHLFFVTLTTLCVQALVIALGVASVCWRAEHTHDGAEAMDCPHHGLQPASHAHHAQHPDETQPAHQHPGDRSDDAKDDDDRLTCGCSSNVMAVYSGPAGVVAAPAFLSTPTKTAGITRTTDVSPDDVRLPPLAPPPRTPFFQFS